MPDFLSGPHQEEGRDRDNDHKGETGFLHRGHYEEMKYLRGIVVFVAKDVILSTSFLRLMMRCLTAG